MSMIHTTFPASSLLIHEAKFADGGCPDRGPSGRVRGECAPPPLVLFIARGDRAKA